METPIAELEMHGMDIRFIHEVEEVYGIYIKDIRMATASDLKSTVNNFGKKATRQLQQALTSLWEEIQHG